MKSLRMPPAWLHQGAGLGLLLTVAGCNVQVSADSASLCRDSEPAAGWSGSYLPVYDDAATQLRYVLDLSDAPRRPDDAPGRYWVALSVLSLGRATNPPLQPRPALYQPDAAWVEVNGRQFAATGDVRYGQPGGRHAPGEPVTALPIDLNGPELVFSAVDAQRIEIAFRVPPPGPRDHWVVHPGNLRITGTTVALPQYRSCFHPGGPESRPPWQG